MRWVALALALIGICGCAYALRSWVRSASPADQVERVRSSQYRMLILGIAVGCIALSAVIETTR